MDTSKITNNLNSSQHWILENFFDRLDTKEFKNSDFFYRSEEQASTKI